jgi:hypothetical protein
MGIYGSCCPAVGTPNATLSLRSVLTAAVIRLVVGFASETPDEHR